MRCLVALAGLGVVLLAVGGAAAAPTDPIVGTWMYGSGRVVVRGSGTSFTATVTAATRFAVCTHARGEQMWTISHTGRWYSGRHLSFDDRIPGCDADDRVWLPTAWSVEGNRLTARIARFAGIAPGPCSSALTVCFTLARVALPEPRALSLDVLGPPQWGEWTLAPSYRASAIAAKGSFTLLRGRVSGLGGKVTVAHDNGDEPKTVFELKLAGALGFGREGSSQLLRARVSVVSGAAGCNAGETGTIWLKDAPSGDLFALRVCGERLQFKHGVGGARVKISLR